MPPAASSCELAKGRTATCVQRQWAYEQNFFIIENRGRAKNHVGTVAEAAGGLWVPYMGCGAIFNLGTIFLDPH